MNASEFGCGHAHQVAITAAKAGWEIADFTALQQSEELCRVVLGVIRNGGLPTGLGSTEEQLVSWRNFYTKYFGIECGDIKIPTRTIGFDRLIVVPQGITMNRIVEVARKQIEISLYVEDLDANVPTNDRDPKSGGYAIWVRERQEADEELKNLSAIALAEKSVKGITLLERLLYGFKYFLETEKCLDETNWTLCSGSRGLDGDVPRVRWNPDARCVGVYWSYLRGARVFLRSRAVVTL